MSKLIEDMKAKPKLEAETVTVERIGVVAACKRCGHHWTYFGTRIFSNCPMCRTTVRFGSWIKEENKT